MPLDKKVPDRFQYCLGRCRTSSSNLYHMNQFLSEQRYCYAPRPPPPGLQTIVAQRAQNCDDACAASAMVCEVAFFPQINTCGVLEKHFKCSTCSSNSGYDQPAFVSLSAPAASSPGACLHNGQAAYFSCSGKHPQTTRVCPCRPTRVGELAASG
jgi:hypothetical protein